MGKGLLNFFRRDPLVELIERRNKFDEMSHEVRIEIKSYEERGIKEGDKDYQNYIAAKNRLVILESPKRALEGVREIMLPEKNKYGIWGSE